MFDDHNGCQRRVERSPEMLAATLLSIPVVFLAELGDRSQLITMTYALRFRWWVVLSGVTIAAFGVHGISVTIGHFLGATLPARPMAFASAIAFLLFAVWTWREGAGDDETVATAPEPRFALLTVVSSFTLAEMSDKTTLATMTLASDHDWAGVWIGSTLGMVLADALAIGAGMLLHRRLPQRLLHVLAGVLFLLFGLWMLFDSALGWRSVAIAVTAAVALAAVPAATAQTLRRRRTEASLARRSPETA
jgi:putative Ca2+/H+ antiporter (TMEM165/GDT1 family)